MLVDYKGGATFDVCADLPHIVGVVTDLDDGLAARALRSLDAELRDANGCSAPSGATDLAGHRAVGGHPRCPPRRRDRRVRGAGRRPARLPRRAGRDRPARPQPRGAPRARDAAARGVVSDDIRANTNLRLALRLHDRADAIDVVGDPAPAVSRGACQGAR